MLLCRAHTLGLIPFLLALLETFILEMAACGVNMDVLQGEQHFLLWFWRWQTVNRVFKAPLMVFQPYSQPDIISQAFHSNKTKDKRIYIECLFPK